MFPISVGWLRIPPLDHISSYPPLSLDQRRHFLLREVFHEHSYRLMEGIGFDHVGYLVARTKWSFMRLSVITCCFTSRFCTPTVSRSNLHSIFNHTINFTKRVRRFKRSWRRDIVNGEVSFGGGHGHRKKSTFITIQNYIFHHACLYFCQNNRFWTYFPWTGPSHLSGMRNFYLS